MVRILFLCIILIILGNTVFSVFTAENVEEPEITVIDSLNQTIIWEFDDSNNYLTNNTVIEDGNVQLKKTESVWSQSNKRDFLNGSSNYLQIKDDGSLILEPEFEEKIIDVNTERNKSFKIDHDHRGTQTFKGGRSFTLSKIEFLASLDGDVTENLNVSIKTMDGETLAQDSISSESFKFEKNEIIAEFNCEIDDDTSYQIVFESEAIEGYYEIIGESGSEYSDGGFILVELNDEDGSDEPEDPEIEDTGDDLEFEIYAVVYSDEGQFISEVFDANVPVFWKSITWTGKIEPEIEDINIEVRSGNSSEPSENSWTNWIQLKSLGFNTESKINLPPTRYIQYTILIWTEDLYQTPIIE
jgi:hypothetical protein